MDKRDGKIMANSGGDSQSRTIEADQSTVNGTKNSPIEAYYEFPSSNVEQRETYSTRMSALEEKLGNKDSVKG